MFEISQEDQDVVTMCNWNHRRSRVTTTVGYIFTPEQAMEYAAMKAQQKRPPDWKGAAFTALAALVIIVLNAVTLIGG